MGPRSEKLSPIAELCVVIIPSLGDYKYLQYLYREILELAKGKGKKLLLYSPSGGSAAHNPFEILFLLLRRKVRTDGRSILHLHWIEFLYQWGNNKYFILFNVPFLIVFFRFFKRFSKSRLFVTVHNILPHSTHWFAIEYIFFRIMLRELSDGVFVHNDSTKISLVNFYGVPEKKIRVIRHGFIGSKSFNRYDREVRAKFNISKRDFVLFFIGSISDYKGIEILLKAAKELFITEVGENLRIIIAGRTEEGYLRYLLKAYNETLKDKRVTFISKYLSEEEVNDIFNETDFGICPYTIATTPSTILDFMHRKLPIITTDDPNVLDLIKNYPAIIAKRGDSHSLASCISFAYNQRTEYAKKAKAFDSKSLLDAWRISAEITLESYMASTSGMV